MIQADRKFVEKVASLDATALQEGENFVVRLKTGERLVFDETEVVSSRSILLRDVDVYNAKGELETSLNVLIIVEGESIAWVGVASR